MAAADRPSGPKEWSLESLRAASGAVLARLLRSLVDSSAPCSQRDDILLACAERLEQSRDPVMLPRSPGCV